MVMLTWPVFKLAHTGKQISSSTAIAAVNTFDVDPLRALDIR